MEYYVNPAKFSSAFVVPCEVVDRHLRLAGSAQLKVLLCMLRSGGNMELEDMAKALNLTCADISDCLQYWLEAGIVLKNGQTPPTSPVSKPEPEQQPKTLKIAAPVKPSREEVAQRGNESKEIAFMLSEAQLKFGRIINHQEAATLVWLHDYEGLPVSIILMVIEYAISQGKNTMKYIEKTAVDWASKDIDTLEKAERHLVEITARTMAWRKVESAFGLDHRRPSPKEEEYSFCWVERWGFSKAMLRAAYDQCVDSTSKLSLPYINKILEKWHKLGFQKPEDIVADSKPASKPQKGGFSNSSLDFDEIEQIIRQNSMD